MSSGKTSKRKITEGLFWSFSERFTAQIVSTVVSIVLARILTPEHYGIISIVAVFITICNVFVTSGFGSAIVQKKEVDTLDYNTAFWVSFGISVVLYIVLFIFSPLIAYFYKMPELKWVIRIMAIRLPIASINTIQQAHIRRQMVFKKFFIATLFGTVISGFVGIIIAMNGGGVWALVAQYLTNTCIDTIVLCFVSEWNPKFEYSHKRAKSIFSFGWKVLVTDFVATLESDIRSLIVAKVFGSADLAFYDQGKKYPSLLVININSSINKVMLPAYSKYQDNLPELKRILRRSIQLGVYILAPMLIGFAMISDVFVGLVLTDKWMPCVPFVRIFCIIFMLRPLETACHQAILAIGKSNVVLRIMIMINIIALTTVIIATFVFKSVILVAYGSLLSTIVSVLAFMFAINKYIGYSLKEQVHDVSGSLLISILMGIFVYIIGKLGLSLVVTLIFQILSGAIIYIFSHIY